VLASAGCGSRRVAPPIQAADDISLHETLAELEGMECPEGVDEALWVELKDALAEALKDSCRAGIHPRRSTTGMKDGGHKWPPYSDSSADGDGHSMLCPYKSVATPPTGDANKVTDLTILDNGDGTFTLSWHYKNLGDYDQNGTVGISDITPIAQHYNETYDIEDENCLLAVIDGSGSGRIGIEDITPIAIYFAAEVAEYAVEGAVSAEGEYAEIGAVAIATATGKDTGRAEFEYALTPGENGYFRVVPRDSEGTPGDASNVVGLALEVLSVSPLEVKEGTVVTFAAEVIGAGPIDYAWDFGGQAVPPTSTEAEPEVVLTRDVGEFSASLTVSNPQGDVTYPFTLTKLGREWKFETILSNVEISTRWPQMKVHRDKLWIHACEDTLSPPPNANYVISGLPGNWDIEEVAFRGMLSLDSAGKPGVAYRGGVLLAEVLSLAELREDDWQPTELIGARIFNRVNFTYANGNEPVITFTMPDERNHLIEYFWRRDDEWEREIVDEPGTPRSHFDTTSITTGPEGNPVLCYNAYEYGEFNECRIAWWNSDIAQWDTFVVEDYRVQYPTIDFQKADRLCVNYSSFYEYEPDIYHDRLIYAVYDGDIWEKEVVNDLSCSAYSKRYHDACLMHDPLAQPVIAVSVLNEEDQSELYLFWRDGGDWYSQMLAEEGLRPSIVLDSKGTWFITYHNASTKEVIVGVYE